MHWVIDLLAVQGLLGGFDVLWHHEWRERLPSRRECLLEQKLHGVRELLYAVSFIGLAWWEWRGAYAWLLASVVALEILLTAWDFVEEDRVRRLPSSERVTHLILSINGGAYLALLAPFWLVWVQAGTEMAAVDYGVRSWVLTALGLGVLAWGIRDLMSAFRIRERRSPSALIPSRGEV